MKHVLKRFLRRFVDVPLGSIISVDTQEKVVALTFDDGPHPVHTPRLLDILSRFDAKATFFVTGAAAEECPAVIRRIAAEGHELGNHTYHHPSLPLLSKNAINEEMLSTHELLVSYAPTHFRPPYGHQTPMTQYLTWANGYRPIFWNIDCVDWECDDGGRMAQSIVHDMRPGSIVLLHDRLASASENRFRDRRPTLQAVETVLELLTEYKFVTVSDLLACGKPVRRLWWSRPDAPFAWRHGTQDGEIGERRKVT